MDDKTGLVSPTFKKGSRQLAKNYTPVSFTFIVIRDQTLDHLICNESDVISTWIHERVFLCDPTSGRT